MRTSNVDVAVRAGSIPDRRCCEAARSPTCVDDSGVVWAHQLDHPLSVDQKETAGGAVDDVVSGRPPVPSSGSDRDEQCTGFPDDRGGALDETTSTARQPVPGDAGSLVITYSSLQHAFDTDEERFLRQWYAKIERTDDNGTPIHQVGDVIAYTLAYEQMGDPFGLLDGESVDLGHIAGHLFDMDTGDLNSDLLDQIEAFGEGILIIDSVRLDPAWRGHGLGPLVAGLVIEQLGEGRRFVALQAAPTERRNAAGEVVDKISDAEREVAARKLGMLWSQLGFEFFRGDVWILDLGLVTFADRLKAIRRGLGLLRA